MKTRMEQAADVAEKAVLVPVGAALVTRDRVKEAIDELRSTYSTRKKTEAELKPLRAPRLDSALKPLVRDAKKTRERVEKELRYGRTRIEKDVRMVVRDFEPVAKNVELVTARVENAVQSGKTAATKAVDDRAGAHRRPRLTFPHRPQYRAPPPAQPMPRLPSGRGIGVCGRQLGGARDLACEVVDANRPAGVLEHDDGES